MGPFQNTDRMEIRHTQSLPKMNIPSELAAAQQPKNASLEDINTTLQLIENDPIIQQLLATRGPITDVNAEEELERQCRMYSMLRYSRKYRKMQVAQANEKWDATSSECFDSILNHADLNNKDLEKCVSFPSSEKHDSGINTPTLSSQEALDQPKKKRAPRVSFSENVQVIQESEPVKPKTEEQNVESDDETLYQERRFNPKSFVNLFRKTLIRAYKGSN